MLYVRLPLMRQVGPLAGDYAVACTPDGSIFMDGILFRLSEHRYWYGP